mmetsp:Transcript_17253/g.26040  ORF Transcript_17253/g.26040 Transcript_17253/m.26040 type:complete len:147 (-) Transcript_17253:196-636(-)
MGSICGSASGRAEDPIPEPEPPKPEPAPPAPEPEPMWTEETWESFLRALEEEHVEGNAGAVKAFYEKEILIQPDDPVPEKFRIAEMAIRSAEDKREAITKLQKELIADGRVREAAQVLHEDSVIEPRPRAQTGKSFRGGFGDSDED